MKLEFIVDVGIDFFADKTWVNAILPELDDGRVTVSSGERLMEILDICKEAESVGIASVTRFSEEDRNDLDFYELAAKKWISLSLGAWEANFEAVQVLNPVNKGGWAPVSIPRSLVYATKLKKPRDIAYLMDPYPELVVSDSFLGGVSALDSSVYGEPLYTGKRKERQAIGVKQLCVERYAEPCLISASVGYVKGVRFKVDGFPQSDLVHLSVPVLPHSMRDSTAGLMRSAEPWSVDLVPGWIATKDIAGKLAKLSREVVLQPILTEGSALHSEHEEAWAQVKKIVDAMPNTYWSGAWEIEDMAGRFRA